MADPAELPGRRPGRKQRRFRQRITALRLARNGRSRRQISRAAVPSFFTLMNLFCGFLALTQILEARLAQACWLIALAGFFDVLDGMMARLTKSQSGFGGELDSLSDLVSFGVAPAFLVYAFGLKEMGVLGLIVSSLPAVCGAVRLARFNLGVDGEKKGYFIGLPIPVQAITIAALILNFNDPNWFSDAGRDLTLLVPIVIVSSGLMVSSVRFDALPKPTAAFIRANRVKAIAYLVGIVLIVFLQEVGLLIGLAAYVSHGVGRALASLARLLTAEPADGDDNAEPVDHPSKRVQ